MTNRRISRFYAIGGETQRKTSIKDTNANSGYEENKVPPISQIDESLKSLRAKKSEVKIQETFKVDVISITG